MSKTIVFIHGAWVTPACWDDFSRFFKSRGYECLAPPWPFHDRPVDELRASPDPALSRLGVAEIVDGYEKFVRALLEPPILIGHSFGGLFVQILLDRGMGAAGVAIDAAPPRGVFAFQPTVLRANSRVLFTWRGWKRVVRMSFRGFRYAFVRPLPDALQHATYDRHVIPETGRIFFQAGFAMLDRRKPTMVNFANNDRAPLLLIAGSKDLIVPAPVNRSNYRKFSRSTARTDFKEFPGRAHWIIAQEGWEEVAGFVADWLEGVRAR